LLITHLLVVYVYSRKEVGLNYFQLPIGRTSGRFNTAKIDFCCWHLIVASILALRNYLFVCLSVIFTTTKTI